MPKSLQPNKSILLKAIDDANTSTSHSSRKHLSSEDVKSRLGAMRNDKNFSKISLKMNDRDEREEEKFNSNESLRTSRRTIKNSNENFC